MYVLLATYDPLKLQVTGISFDSWICTKISAFLSALRTNTIISNPQPHMTTKKVHSHHSISNAHPRKYFTKAGRDMGRPQTTTFISPHTFTRPIRIVLNLVQSWPTTRQNTHNAAHASLHLVSQCLLSPALVFRKDRIVQLVERSKLLLVYKIKLYRVQ